MAVAEKRATRSSLKTPFPCYLNALYKVWHTLVHSVDGPFLKKYIFFYQISIENILNEMMIIMETYHIYLDLNKLLFIILGTRITMNKANPYVMKRCPSVYCRMLEWLSVGFWIGDWIY
jgi:hypothetical protein